MYDFYFPYEQLHVVVEQGAQNWLDYLKSFAIPVTVLAVGVITVCVNIRFNRRNVAIANKEFNLKLFDKRYPVFLAIKTAYVAVIEASTSEDLKRERKQLFRYMSEALFLFEGHDISSVLDDCKKSLHRAVTCRMEMERLAGFSTKSPDELSSLKKLQKQLLALQDKADKEIGKLEEAFSPYLKVPDVFPD